MSLLPTRSLLSVDSDLHAPQTSPVFRDLRQIIKWVSLTSHRHCECGEIADCDMPTPACRYHPHLQGSTALQAQTASGPITVDSDIDFLTPQKGCGPLSILLQAVQTRVLYLQTLFFEDADVEKDPA